MDPAGTFTYDSALPTARDRMRHALGDTDATAPLRWDETYAALLALHDEPTATAIMARSLANQFGQQPSSVNIPGALAVSFTDRVKAWLQTAQSVEETLTELGAGGYVVTRAERSDLPADDDGSEYYRTMFSWP
jgi:hypothetical protein